MATKSFESSAFAKQKEAERELSNEVFDQLDEDQSDSVSLAEMETFVASNSKLWAFLSVHFGLPVADCKEVATRVAMELATGRHGKSALKREISRNQFHRFRKYYIEDPDGAREFFQHTIFETFDTNHDSLLDEGEVENLCDALYGASSYLESHASEEMEGGFLQGTLKLPPREIFVKNLFDNCDKDKDGKLELLSILDFLKKKRKKNLENDREKGIHKEDRQHAEKLAHARADAAARVNRETESVKNERDWWDDIWDWLSEVFHS